MLPLFVYGSLVDPAILARVCRRRVGAFPTEPATLSDHRRVYVAGAWYPTVVKCCGRRVDGLLIDGLDRDCMRRLGEYEGPEYETRARQVVGARRGKVTARVFIARPGIRLLHQDWDPEGWAEARGRLLRNGGRAADA